MFEINSTILKKYQNLKKIVKRSKKGKNMKNWLKKSNFWSFSDPLRGSPMGIKKKTFFLI